MNSEAQTPPALQLYSNAQLLNALVAMQGNPKYGECAVTLKAAELAIVLLEDDLHELNKYNADLMTFVIACNKLLPQIAAYGGESANLAKKLLELLAKIKT